MPTLTLILTPTPTLTPSRSRCCASMPAGSASTFSSGCCVPTAPSSRGCACSCAASTPRRASSRRSRRTAGTTGWGAWRSVARYTGLHSGFVVVIMSLSHLLSHAFYLLPPLLGKFWARPISSASVSSSIAERDGRAREAELVATRTKEGNAPPLPSPPVPRDHLDGGSAAGQPAWRVLTVALKSSSCTLYSTRSASRRSDCSCGCIRSSPTCARI